MHGRQLARGYELLEPIGDGTFARVWRGVSRGDAGFERMIAIRAAHEDWSPYATTIAGELARVVAIPHPSLEAWLDVVVEGGELFLVSEWIESVSLGTWVASHRARGAKTPWPIAAAVVIEALSGLDALHAHGRAHEGITSRAIRMDRHGRARLARSGLTSALREAGVDRTRLVDLGLAHPPPLELLAGASPDATSDVFGAGWTLFEALAMQAPASGPAAEVQVALVRGELPDLATLRPDVPAAIIAIVERAMRASPRERFDSAHAMARALAQLLRSGTEDTSARTIARSVDEVLALTAPAEVPDELPSGTERPLGIAHEATMHVELAELSPVPPRSRPAGLAPQKTELLDEGDLDRMRVLPPALPSKPPALPSKLDAKQPAAKQPEAMKAEPKKADKPAGLKQQMTEMLDDKDLAKLRLPDDDR